MGFELNPSQMELVKRIKSYIRNQDKPFYYYSGRAGTGKTTVIRKVLDDLDLQQGEYICCAYIGKAVMVLLRKGYTACTLHSLMYETIIDTTIDTVINENGDEVKKKKSTFRFKLKKELPENLKLIIVDESKMVPDKMIMELLSFGKPIIFMGDINQLPPVMGSSTILSKPDYELNDIMRQAEDDPIVILANRILDNKPIQYGEYGLSKVVRTVPFDKTLLTDYDVIICGRNKTRDYYNQHIRSDILRMRPDRIYVGEKLICRQNNWDESIGGIYLTNGTVGFVEDIHYDTMTKWSLDIDFRPDFMDECFEELSLDRRYFYLPYDERQNYGISRYNKFEFGYALTTHLVQGSEFPDVLYIDEWMHDEDLTRALRYTAVTRAERSITIVM